MGEWGNEDRTASGGRTVPRPFLIPSYPHSLIPSSPHPRPFQLLHYHTQMFALGLGHFAGVHGDVAHEDQSSPERANELEHSGTFVSEQLTAQLHALHDVDLTLQQFDQLAFVGVVALSLERAELRDESIQLGGAPVTGESGDLALALLDARAGDARGALDVAPQVGGARGKRRHQVDDRAYVIGRIVRTRRPYLAGPRAQQRREMGLVPST